eukprot:COSAG03_NODE_4403_length_1564_cov_1.421843_1_plen_67_part_10
MSADWWQEYLFANAAGEPSSAARSVAGAQIVEAMADIRARRRFTTMTDLADMIPSYIFHESRNNYDG